MPRQWLRCVTRRCRYQPAVGISKYHLGALPSLSISLVFASCPHRPVVPRTLEIRTKMESREEGKNEKALGLAPSFLPPVQSDAPSFSVRGSAANDNAGYVLPVWAEERGHQKWEGGALSGPPRVQNTRC